jgi:glycine oxidase
MRTVAVVGGGLIGLSIAWRCARRGFDVTVYDPDIGPKASTVAAGMLAPTCETYTGEEDLQRLLTVSALRWPDFAAELARETGADLGYRDEGTLLVALTDDDLREVLRLCDRYERAGLPASPESAARLREREPLLSPRIRGGAWIPNDRQVDPRRVLAALRNVVANRVPTYVADMSTIDADVTVIAAGIGTAALTGLPVRPIKGQTVRLKAPAPPVRHVIRGYARSRPVYLVPRRDGEVVIGATEEERGTDTTVTAGGLLDLLGPAAELVPGIVEYPVTETPAGLRPGTPDNAPIIGPLAGNMIVAAGHYRNGVLLAPVTADAVADLVATGAVPDVVKPFTPDRFREEVPSCN